jgi:hypothetical protein
MIIETDTCQQVCNRLYFLHWYFMRKKSVSMTYYCTTAEMKTQSNDCDVL